MKLSPYIYFLGYLISIVLTEENQFTRRAVGSDELIESYTFHNESHFQESQLWRNLTTKVDMDMELELNTTTDATITIHFNNTNTTYVLVSLHPLKFQEIDPGIFAKTFFSTTVPLSGCLRMINDTSSITHIEARDITLTDPPHISFGINVLLSTLSYDFGLDGTGAKFGLSNTMICRGTNDQTIQILKKMRYISLPEARVRNLSWDKNGKWTKEKWQGLYTWYKFKKLGLLFFNMNELKYEKPYCESRPEYLQCQSRLKE